MIATLARDPLVEWTERGWLHAVALTLAGAVAAIGFAPFHVWGVSLLALAVLFIRLAGVSGWDRPVRAGFRTGLLFGLGWFSASCFWIASAFIERGPEFIPMIPPLVGGLAVVLSLFWGLAGGAVAFVARSGRPVETVLMFLSAFLLAELARGHVFSGFPWNMVAYAFEPGGAISQSASLFGVYGLSGVALLISALVGVALIARDWRPAVGSAVLLGGLYGFGAHRLSDPVRDIQPGVTLRLVAVPFSQSEKINPETSIDIVNGYLGVSLRPGIETVSHIVWPEGALNGVAIEDEYLLRFFGRELSARTTEPPVWLMNSLRQERSPDRNGVSRRRYYNSSFAVTFDEEGNPAVAASNDKRKLVPFGEFIPGGRFVETLGAQLVSTALGSITPAPRKRVAEFPGLPPLSPQICYEVIFPGLTPSGDPTHGEPAPQAILNQSNDAWFGGTTGPAQHAAIARYRAIEEGLPLIRSAANGISGVFNPYGRADRILDGKNMAHLDAALPMALSATPYSRNVNYWLSILNLCLFLWLLIRARRKVGRIGRMGEQT